MPAEDAARQTQDTVTEAAIQRLETAEPELVELAAANEVTVRPEMEPDPVRPAAATVTEDHGLRQAQPALEALGPVVSLEPSPSLTAASAPGPIGPMPQRSQPAQAMSIADCVQTRRSCADALVLAFHKIKSDSRRGTLNSTAACGRSPTTIGKLISSALDRFPSGLGKPGIERVTIQR
jgi:hypothetical protein